MQRLEKLSSQKVAVGVPKNAGESSDKNYKGSNERKGSEDIDNADLAYIHTNGIRTKAARAEMQPEINKGTPYSVAMQMYIHEHGSMAYQAPPRPIIQPAIEDSKAQLGKLLGAAAKDAADGEDTEQALENVGLEAQAKVKGWFTNPKNGWPANAPSTIKAKGSDQPLIDTGALRDAITYVVREGNKND